MMVSYEKCGTIFSLMEQQTLIPHLFRSEFRKITSVLCKYFGAANIDIAEDITSETFLSALETWPYKGIPENPVAWLYTVAKNKAKNYLQRNKLFDEKISVKIKNDIENNFTEIDLSEKNISDSQLQMLFAICNPAISDESQIALALRILCGFGIEEIANAFLTSKETIHKRVVRAKEKLRAEKIKIEFPGQQEIESRLDTVLKTLYLLFNEGYYSESNDSILREDLCMEAMRLTYFLIEYEPCSKVEVNALMSLMCFHASRFESRKNKNGEIILYDDQDENLWNHELIAKGAYFLNEASKGNKLSAYHLEAGIAYWNTIKEDSKEKWENILQLYNQLLQFKYSPSAALNRTFAFSKVYGKLKTIDEAEKLNLNNNHYYFVLLAELYLNINNKKVKENFEKALRLARNNSERILIQKKLSAFLLR